MPAIVPENDYRELSQKELADLIDRAPATLSQAVRRTHYCAGYPVFDWAKWHPAGNQVECYQVPIRVLKEKLPKEEYTEFGIFD